MESNLFLENIYNKEYTNHEFFFSEIKSADPNIHYNTVNEFSIPITLPNEEPMKFNKGSIVHLKEMTLPSNVIVLTESEQAVKDNVGSFCTRLEFSEPLPIFQKGSLAGVLENDIKIGLYLSRIQYYMDFGEGTVGQESVNWPPITKETCILDDLLTGRGPQYTWSTTVAGAYNTLTENTISDDSKVIKDWFLFNLLRIKRLPQATTVKIKDFITPMLDFYYPDVAAFNQMVLPTALMSNYYFTKTTLADSWIGTAVDNLFRLLFKESSDGKEITNELQWVINNSKAYVNDCGAAESLFLLYGRRPFIYYNNDDLCPQWDYENPWFPTYRWLSRQIALPDLMLHSIYESVPGLQSPGRMQVFDFGKISNNLVAGMATAIDNDYEELFTFARNFYQTYIPQTKTWIDKTYAEVKKLPFMIFVEHVNNTKDVNMLKLIDPNSSDEYFSVGVGDINPRKITYRITPMIFTLVNGVYDVRDVKVDLYLQNFILTTWTPQWSQDQRNLAYKQFVPWNVGFAVESFINNCAESWECRWLTSSITPWIPTTFKPLIDLVYRTCISNVQPPPQEYINRTDKNDTSILNGFLQNSVKTYMNANGINSINLPLKNGLPLFPPHHFLNLMTQIFYPVPQNAVHFKTYKYTRFDVRTSQIPIPFYKSREVVWKDYQFRAPDFLHNSLSSGNGTLKALNIPYGLGTATIPDKPIDIAPRVNGPNFWILPSLTASLTLENYQKTALSFLAPYPTRNDNTTSTMTISTNPPPKANDDVFFLTKNRDAMMLNPNTGDPYVELLFYLKEIEPVISNDIQPPLNSTLFLKRKRAPTDDDYNKCKIASKSYLNQSDISQLNVYSSTDSGGILYQVDAQGNIINNWTQSLPIRNLKLSIYEPMANIGNKRYTVVLQRERTKFDVEKNPYTFKMSAENIRSIAGLSRSKRKYLCTLAIINGMSTQIKNFKPLDKNMWITIDGIEQQAVFLNSQVMDNVIMTVDMAPYIALGDSSVNINFENETNPQFDGLYRKFVINDADDFGHLYVTFYNSDHERLIFDETTVYNNPSLTFYFQII